MSRPFQLRLVSLAVLLLASSSHGEDWPQFRGVNSSGVAAGSPAPTEFGPGKNELWSAPIGVGHSSPCVVGDTIYLTTYAADSSAMSLVAINRLTGETRWRTRFKVEQVERGHPSFNPASSSPACDGERVVAYFGSYGLVSVDVRGEKQWEIRMPVAKTYGGNAASPIIVGDRVILYRATYNDHFLLAVDKTSGKQLWKKEQPEPFTGEMACTACPIVAGDKLIVHTARSLQALDIATGEQLWIVKCATTATSTPIVVGDEIIVAAWNKLGEPALRPEFPSFEQLIEKHDRDKDQLIGRDELPKLWIFHRPEGMEAPMNGATIRFRSVDRNGDQRIERDEWNQQISRLERFRSGYKTHGILAVPFRGGDSDEPIVPRTLETQAVPEVPSPISDGKFIYFVKNGGVLTCLDAKSGKRIYRTRTPGRGTHYASPVISGNNLYTISGDGKISVIMLGRRAKILATNDMQDPVYATPAIVDGVLYVRTHHRLYAFAKRPAGD